MVKGMIAMMEQDEFTGPVNLGNPQEISIAELAESIIESTDSKAGTEYQPLPPDDPVRRCPDISLAKAQLNWQPEIDFKTGLSQTIEYFKNKLEAMSIA
jgi:UDP-glucuronate decarboxylase